MHENPYSVIISIPRHQIVIQIVANLSSRLSRYNRSLRFSNIAEALERLIGEAEASEATYLQFAEQLVMHEMSSRDVKRIAQNMRRAGFPLHKTLAEFDYQAQTTVSKREINALLDFTFVEQRQNLVFIGPPGVGKTHLASGIAVKAIDAGYKSYGRKWCTAELKKGGVSG